MRYFYLVLSALCLAGWIYLGNTPGVGGAPIPAMGKFFHPVQGFWGNTHPAANRSHGRQLRQVDHPLAKGSIYFDDRGVPHIFADDLIGSCFLQGYVHAADRMWQMDISTRATEGRLSEVLGDRTLARDRDQVRKGYREAARRETSVMRSDFPADYRALEAYAAGFNAYRDALAPEDYPVEYKLLNHEPLRWSPYRTALLMKGMSQSLSGRYTDAATAKTQNHLGPELYRVLFPEQFPRAEPIVPSEGQYPKTAAFRGLPTSGSLPASGSSRPATTTSGGAAGKASSTGASPGIGFNATELQRLRDYEAGSEEPYTLMPPHPNNGSNNWAVAGDHSNTGRPILASDPHLQLTLPSIWYECQVRYPGVNARGVSLPGSPGIIIGFNDHLAYGETNVGHDVTDWFRITWTDSSRTSYLLDGEAVAATIITDTIRHRSAPPEAVRVPWTIFGPVPFTEGPYADHAMRWLAHDAPGKDVRPHSMVGTFLGLMAGTGYDDYRQALTGYVDPPQNFVYADKDGTIAIRPNGAFPLRGLTDGRTPAAGDKRANNWQGYLPFPLRPEHKNPARGFVSSANQESTASNFPYKYHGGFDEYRGRLINRRLRRQRVLNQRQIKELQLESSSLLAEELTPLLIARINRSALDDDGRRLLRLISEWDYDFRGDSRAATFFEQWRRLVYKYTFDELPRDSGYVYPELWRWNDLLRTQPRHPVFDLQETADFRENAATLTQRAFDELLEEYGSDGPATYNEHRNTRIRHLGAVPGLGTGLIKTDGTSSSPRALSATNGASWRMVVELGEQPRAWGTLPGGASGDAASPFYDNMVEEWAAGRYHELVRWPDTTTAASAATGSWVFLSTGTGS